MGGEAARKILLTPTVTRLSARTTGRPDMSGQPPDSHRANITRLPPAEYVGEITSRYAAGETPWDTGVPNPALVKAVESGGLRGRTLLELGCGTGTNAIELARRGFRVTAVDLVDVAIRRAREKAKTAGVTVDFRCGDLTRLGLGGPYDCLVDIGCYHGLRNRSLDAFQSTLARVSRTGTRWLSVAGSANDTGSEGPPRVREEEFRRELGGLFDFLDVHEFRFDIRPDFRPLMWSILMERR